ncbi:alpha/beta hydrolase [Salisediminibacterium beveridgei]|uniref:alpha/beta hydrolase n=1 Tax=Salisediminibacterium beveridgei TaxID=632773 RepID=UPI0018DE1CAC|nr:alpha/beta fold hydrolase [Salisediminibacterium beveridgei]
MEQHQWITGRDGLKIAAVIHFPEEYETNKQKTIIYGHGFTGNKTGDNRMGVKLARFLSREGYVVIRFDYIGSGESEGDFEDKTTVSGWLYDFKTVMEFTKNKLSIDNKNICFIGHSLSGAIVTQIAASSEQVGAVCVLAPVHDLVNNIKVGVIGEGLWENALQGERIHDFFNKKYAVDSRFVKEMYQYDMDESIKSVSVPFFIVHGEKDEVIPFTESQKFHQKLTGNVKHIEIMKGEGHLFSDSLFPLVSTWLQDSFK